MTGATLISTSYFSVLGTLGTGETALYKEF